MKNHIRFLIFTLLFFSGFFSSKTYSLDLLDKFDFLDKIGIEENEGETSFRTLLIPIGGRPESLGSAFTGLCDDVSYINYNPAGSCIQNETQISVFHNSWISDSKMDTIAYTTRFRNLGIGTQFSCFYVPFTEYNSFGNRVNSSYYSETSLALNFAYNFKAGYKFKGIAVGASAKTSWRGMPNYTDDNSGFIIKNSGIQQSGLGVMVDVGALMQFNFLKFFTSREPNVRIGIAAQNLGVALTGFTNKIVFDDPLPSYFAIGISCQFLPIIGITIDFKQPVNLLNWNNYLTPAFGFGIILDFIENFNLLAGFELKGGNPRLSLGGEFQLTHVRLNFNYSLDFTSSFTPINRISMAAKIMLGDKGRKKTQTQIDELFSQGLVYYYKAEWDLAIETWKQILKLNKNYDPALLGIKSAETQKKLIDEVQNSMYFK